jgi:hypothetical protein
LKAEDAIGWSVALDANIAVIGTYNPYKNVVYVFETIDDSSSSLSSWTQTAILTGSASGYFGVLVAVSGNWIIVDAPWDNNINGNKAGSVFVFTKLPSSSLWTQVAQLTAADGAPGDDFGTSASISKDGSTIVVGAVAGDFNASVLDTGAAYLFRTTDSTAITTAVEWTQVEKFVAVDEFGISIALENDIVVVGASGDDSASGITNAGSVYVLSTGFLPSTRAPSGKTTAAPTARQTTKTTMEPNLSPTTTPTHPPTPVEPSPVVDDTSTPLPATSTPPTSASPIPLSTTPPGPTSNATNNSDIATIQPTPAQQPDTDSKSVLTPGVIVGVSALVVVGLVVGGVAALITILKYRLKREARVQQREEQHAINTGGDPFLPMPLTNNTLGTVPIEEPPIMADVLFMPTTQAVQDRTLEVDAFLDPSTRIAVQAEHLLLAFLQLPEKNFQDTRIKSGMWHHQGDPATPPHHQRSREMVNSIIHHMNKKQFSTKKLNSLWRMNHQ